MNYLLAQGCDLGRVEQALLGPLLLHRSMVTRLLLLLLLGSLVVRPRRVLVWIKLSTYIRKQVATSVISGHNVNADQLS